MFFFDVTNIGKTMGAPHAILIQLGDLVLRPKTLKTSPVNIHFRLAIMQKCPCFKLIYGYFSSQKRLSHVIRFSIIVQLKHPTIFLFYSFSLNMCNF